MAIQDPIDLCKICQKRSFSKTQGIVCSITSDKPTFSVSCPDYVEDTDQKRRESRFQEAHNPKAVRKEAAVKMLSGGLPLLAIGLFLIFVPMPYLVGIVGIICLLLGLVLTAYGFARFLVHESEPTKPKTQISDNDKKDLEVY